jgi:hypothetical protein
MVICQAARIEVEREELLDLHRAIVKTSSKLHEGLGAALDNAALEASQHHAFLGEVRTMQESLTADLEKSAFITQNALARLLGEIWSGLDNVATSASSIMDNLRGEAGILAKVTIDHFHCFGETNPRRNFEIPQDPFEVFKTLYIKCRKTQFRGARK